MATLTETAYYTRRAINWAILAVIAYIILRILWGLFASVWLVFFPPKPPPPNHAFGKLPALVFPTPPASPSGQFTLRLETIEGAVPAASPSATVYFMPKTAANLLALSQTQEFAQQLGFDKTPIQENKNIYRFQDPTFPARRLRYDIVSGNFVLRYGFELDVGLFSERNLPSAQTAQSEARNLLQIYDLYPQDFIGGPIKVKHLRFTEGKLSPTTSVTQADAIRVDFFRKPFGQTPLLTAVPDEGLISFIFSASNNIKKRLLQFAYTYWPVDYQNTATYSLKTSNQAWQELQAGEGFITRYPPKGTTAVIRNVYLAYYDSFEPQTYLQPIFVFEGDDGFLAYVPAVSLEWTE